MERGQICYRSLGLITAVMITVGGLIMPLRAETPEYDLFIQRSPAEAGEVTPNTGTHRISANTSITLTADPQPGFRFAYWLGDVSDPSAARTTITVNEPKVVVAIFHPEPTRRIDHQLGPTGSGGGCDMLAPTATDLSAPRWSPAAGAAKTDMTVVRPTVPVVIPEPATIALLALGIVALRRREQPPLTIEPERLIIATSRPSVL